MRHNFEVGDIVYNKYDEEVAGVVVDCYTEDGDEYVTLRYDSGREEDWNPDDLAHTHSEVPLYEVEFTCLEYGFGLVRFWAKSQEEASEWVKGFIAGTNKDYLKRSAKEILKVPAYKEANIIVTYVKLINSTR